MNYVFSLQDPAFYESSPSEKLAESLGLTNVNFWWNDWHYKFVKNYNLFAAYASPLIEKVRLYEIIEWISYQKMKPLCSLDHLLFDMIIIL